MLAIDSLPEEFFVEVVRLLEECFVARVLVHLPGSLDVGDGGGSVHAGHPGHSEIIRQLVVSPVTL